MRIACSFRLLLRKIHLPPGGRLRHVGVYDFDFDFFLELMQKIPRLIRASEAA